MSKESDLKFIKSFSKINIKGICDELKVDKSNLWAGRASESATSAVKNKIIEKIETLRKEQ